MDELSPEQLERFSRQILVEEIGYDGQTRLLSSAVTVRGPEPWAAWMARYLSAAGVKVAVAIAGGTNRGEVILASGRTLGMPTVGAVDGRWGETLRETGLLAARVVRVLSAGDGLGDGS